MQSLSRRAALLFGGAALFAGSQVSASLAQAAIVERAMPEMIIEPVLPSPGPGFAWVPGHWVWRARAWFWVKGHYFRGVVQPMPAVLVETPPPPPMPVGFFWVRGHWAWEGGRWGWHRGAWVR